ncbi:MAG: hypothetical protein J6R18_03400 [Kiritimatiellae bacterium]|nr:hypothetical protein [Kiritimatiellia bacterium]
MRTSRTTETIRFDTGISVAEYASGEGGAPGGERQKQLLPGSTTVSEALSNIFPEGESVVGEIMSALVAGNSAYLRTPSGFGQTARSALRTLWSKKGEAAARAASELESLLADTEVFEHYRAALLET